MGFFTPTEAGSVGTLAVLILAVAKRDITFKRFIASVKDSLVIACMVFVLLAGATILGHFFAITKMPVMVGEWLTTLPVPRIVIMIIIIFVYLIGGSFIEDLAFLILVTPIFLPIILKLGYDPVWFGIIVSVTCMIGIIIPPMAVNVFVVSGITKVPISTIYKGLLSVYRGHVHMPADPPVFSADCALAPSSADEITKNRPTQSQGGYSYSLHSKIGATPRVTEARQHCKGTRWVRMLCDIETVDTV